MGDFASEANKYLKSHRLDEFRYDTVESGDDRLHIYRSHNYPYHIGFTIMGHSWMFQYLDQPDPDAGYTIMDETIVMYDDDPELTMLTNFVGMAYNVLGGVMKGAPSNA